MPRPLSAPGVISLGGGSSGDDEHEPLLLDTDNHIVDVHMSSTPSNRLLVPARMKRDATMDSGHPGSAASSDSNTSIDDINRSLMVHDASLSPIMSKSGGGDDITNITTPPVRRHYTRQPFNTYNLPSSSSSSPRKTRFSDSSAYGDSLVLSSYCNDYGDQQHQQTSSSTKRSAPIVGGNSATNNKKSRRYSIDSQSSSGRGGSSAMSSAEGLGIGDFCQIEYAPHIDYASKSRESVV